MEADVFTPLDMVFQFNLCAQIFLDAVLHKLRCVSVSKHAKP